MSPEVDDYIARAGEWGGEMADLREVLADCGLDDSIKWGKPCFSRPGGGNIAIMQPMKEHLALMFFKGALFDDPHGVMREQGPNSRSAKRMEFASVDDVARLRPVVVEYVERAVEADDEGREAGPAPEPEVVPELRERLDADPALAEAFADLTPGRRREYCMHFADAKKSETRAARVDKYVPKILAGKGMRER